VSGALPVTVELLGIGGLDGPACTLPYDPYVPPLPPAPPTPPEVQPVYCSREMMDNSSLYSVNTWNSFGIQGVTDFTIDATLEQRREYVAAGSNNRSFEITLGSNFFAKTRNVCFGYVKEGTVDFSEAGLDSRENSISLCTNGNHYNVLNLPGGCTAAKVMLDYRRKGSMFRVDRLADRIQIYSQPTEETAVICNFTTVGF